MCIKNPSTLFLLLFLSCSCSEKTEPALDQPKTATAQIEDRFLVNNWGDTIPTGIPVPVEGKRISPAGGAEPKVIALRNKPDEIPYYGNVHSKEMPKAVPIPKQLTILTPGENGVSLPTTVPARGKAAATRQPKPVPALATRFKDAATENIQYLDVDQGMNSSYVWSILEDSRGNLWFGTAGGGVSRYDGSHFTHYTTEEGLSHNSVRSILEDSRGNLWFGTGGGGVSRYDGLSFTHYTTEEGLSNNWVLSMLEDSRGNLWFGTSNGGVNRYDGRTFTHYSTEEGLSHRLVWSILEDNHGDLWFGTGNGVSRYDGQSFTHYTTGEGLSHHLIWSILEDSHGNLWFGTGSGACRYDGNGFLCYTTEEGLVGNSVQAILEDDHGNLWFGTEGGISRYDGTAFTNYTIEEGLSRNNIRSMLEDSRGNLWLGTSGGGVNRYNGSRFTHYTTETGLSDNVIQSIVEDNHGNLWFGTRGGGLSRYDGRYFVHYTTEEGLIHNSVRSILEDSRGNLWLGTEGGLCRYDSRYFTHYTTEEGLSHNWILSMLEDRQGNLWLGTAGGGVNRYDGGRFTHYTTEEGLGNNSVWCMLEDSQGNLWFGTRGGGVCRYNGACFTHYTTMQGLSDNNIWCMLEDKRGNLWFGTEGGLCRYDGVRFTNYTTEAGLSNNWVLSIVEDEQENIWISTQRGITLLKPMTDSFSSTGDSPEEDYKFFTFGKADGLKRLDFEPNSARLDRHNRIWWGSIDGLTMLDLNRFELPAKAPQIRLDYLEVEEAFVDFRKLSDTAYLHASPFEEGPLPVFDHVAPFHNYPTDLELPYRLNHLTFHFSGIDWAAPHKITYQYMMEGIDRKWSPPNGASKADYRNLPAGTHTFKVKAVGAAKLESTPVEYTFTILPPWWLTWWAYLLWGTLTLSGIYLLYRFQLHRQLEKAEAKKLKELDALKTSLYTNITHEFRTPLTIILGMVEQIKVNPKDWYNEGLQMIRRSAGDLLRLVNQLLDLQKLESANMRIHWIQGDILAYVKYVLESFRSLAAGKGVRLRVNTELDVLIMDYDRKKIRDIVSNLLSNAIKFTPEGGEIEVVLAEDSDYFAMKVSDPGPGIPPQKLPHIFDRFYQATNALTGPVAGTGIGLALTKELVELLDGKIGVKSEVGAGTAFTVLLPITRKAESVRSLAPDFQPTAPDLTAEPSISPIVATNIRRPANLPVLLIVEDNADVVQYLRSFLTASFRLKVAINGRDGWDKALQFVPDLIVSDVMMPVMDGFELCDRLKSDERTSHIPIVLLTAKADISSRIEGLKRGADAYLAKPFHREELLVRLQKLMDLRKRLQARYRTSDPPLPSGDSTWPMEDAFMVKLQNLLEIHYSEEHFGITELCRELLMSRAQLYRKLTALTGEPAAAYLRSFRLEKAKELLLNTSLTVSEIAFRTGFKDPGHFSRTFRKAFGKSPSTFRP